MDFIWAILGFVGDMFASGMFLLAISLSMFSREALGKGYDIVVLVGHWLFWSIGGTLLINYILAGG